MSVLLTLVICINNAQLNFVTCSGLPFVSNELRIFIVFVAILMEWKLKRTNRVKCNTAVARDTMQTPNNYLPVHPFN